MKPHTFATLTVSLLAVSSLAFADMSKKDQEFFTKAAGGGTYEVEAGKLAQSKGQSAGVKSFGDMLVKDHGAANDELKALAGKKGVTLPVGVPADKQKKLDKLAASKNFDKDFVNEVGLDDHKADIAMFEKTSTGADDADVKAFAMKTLPTLKTHLQHAESLKKTGAH